MVFSSLIFLFRFMPIFFVIYYLVPAGWKNLILFGGSIIFYAWGEPRYLILVLLSVFVNYFLATFIVKSGERAGGRKFFLFLAILYNVGMLFFFKYSAFFLSSLNGLFGWKLPVPDILLPLGISFYTFQILSYIIDVYRGNCRASNSILNLGTYLIMFPQLIAGPIVIYGDVEKDLKKRKIEIINVERGLKTFSLGLASKVLLANNLGNIWSACGEAGFDDISTPFAWLGIIAYGLQLYFDFNGYSLMAIGLGDMLGFRFPENFDFPYSAASVTDFWRRWHKTLTGWFREYIYIPLGGNRKGKFRTILNILIVWLITGLWHGAAWNFVLWGFYYFLLLALERLFLGKLLKGSRVLSRIYTLFFVFCGWVLFVASSMSEIGILFSRMFVWHPGSEYLEYLTNYGSVLIASVIFATPLLRKYYRNHSNRMPVLIFLCLLFWGSVVQLVDSVYNPFLYFRF
ncbi:MAG: MBOAT family protein [Lachnospiraceae bacterium]|nr:MBOAT family protein [Lachnospiraceae bacterium]